MGANRYELLIRPRAGWASVDLGELWRYRDLLWFLVWRDVKLRYRQTALGVTWAVLQPLLLMVIFAVFFSRFGPADEQGVAIDG